MSSKVDKVRELITEQAGEWFVANREDATPAQHAAFAEWLRTSPVHVEEYLAHSVIARDLRNACEYSDKAVAELVARARAHPDLIAPAAWARPTTGETQRNWRGWRSAVIVAFAVAVVGVLLLARPAYREAAVEGRIVTRHGEQRSLRLADDSVLHLNMDTAVTIRYGTRERSVRVDAGEAYFEIVHDANRPFRVVAGGAQMIDLGTRFDVRLAREGMVVTVAEGNVSVSSGNSEEHPLVQLGAGQQLTVVDGTWPPAQAILVDAEHATAWLHRQIAFDHTPLGKVAAEFNRYASKPFEIVTPGLQKLEISGVFTTDDPAAFIAFLRSLDNVRVEETATQIRVSRDAK